MTVPTFSINAAAEVLERDRRTITKALRHMEPDSKQKGQPRWRLRTILDALDELPGSSNAPRRRNDCNDEDLKDYRGSWRDPRILASIAAFEEASAKMDAIGDLEERRAFAVAKLGPILAFQDQNFEQWEEGDVAVKSRRVAGLWLQELREVRNACSWDEAEADDAMVKPFGYDW
jgi:hypothetical protein